MSVMQVKPDCDLQKICGLTVDGPRKNVQRQYFLFPSDVINHLLNQSNLKVLQKLFKSCKYFLNKKPIPICHNFKTYTNIKPQLYLNSLFLEYDEKKLHMLQNFYFTNRIHIYCQNQNMLHSIIHKIYKCEAKILQINNQSLTIKDFEFLVDSKKVEDFSFYDSVILDEEEKPVSIEYILEKLPNANRIHVVFYIKFLIEPILPLRKLKRNVKFDSFSFGLFSALLNFEKLCNFLLLHENDEDSFFQFCYRLGTGGHDLRDMVTNHSKIKNGKVDWIFVLWKLEIIGKWVKIFESINS